MPQSKNSEFIIKPIQLWAATIVGLIILGTTVYAIVSDSADIDSLKVEIRDSIPRAIAVHDNCETAHPGIRHKLEGAHEHLFEVSVSLDSMKVEQRLFQREVRGDLEEIKQLIKNGNGGG